VRSLPRFVGTSLFDELARTLCRVNVLPRKELYESWEFARRVRRHFRGGRVVDLACGHGLVGALMLILDDSSPEALCTDVRLPKSAPLIRDALVQRWPRLADRVRLEAATVEETPLREGDLVVSVHACGSMSDRVLDRAIEAGAQLALLPCCHPVADPEVPSWKAWVDDALAIDLRRALRLEAAGYQVMARVIPERITPKNRLLLGKRTARA